MALRFASAVDTNPRKHLEGASDLGSELTSIHPKMRSELCVPHAVSVPCVSQEMAPADNGTDGAHAMN
eukprot:1849595-Pleurochrysis_carterae.AAC.1